MDVSSLHRSFRLACLGLIAPLGIAAPDHAVDQVQQVATEWVRTRAETVRAETEWSGQQGMMTSLTGALNERALVIEEKLAHERALTATDRGELDGLAEKNARAGAGLQAAETRLRELTQAVIALRPQLPPRVAAGLDLAYRSLADETLSVGDRMQHAMTVLNRCAQFNRAITCHEEVITLEGEPAPKSLAVIYWGLSHAYALDRAAHRAWLGTTGPTGWHWTPQPGAEEGVARLIAIATDQADPDFVIVPATLRAASRQP